MLTSAPARAQSPDQPLLLAVEVNGHAIDKIGEFVLRGDVLLARRSEWHDLGFRVRSDRADTPDGLLPADSVSHLAWQLDQPTQTLRVTVPTASLLPAVLRIDAPDSSAVPVRSGTGAILDYDINASRAAGQLTSTGLFDLRVFSPWGVASTGLLTNIDTGPHLAGQSPAVRLHSSYTISDPAALRQVVLGDFVTADLSATRPVRLAGLQISSNFSLRPDLVTFPLPTANGTAAVPSTLDILVNGSRMLSQQVAAGPFELPRLPVITGAGTVSMTLTDALGHQVNLNLPFYTSSALLSPGLQTYAAQVGTLRRNFGVTSNDYGPIAASGSYRRGLTQSVTVEMGAQGGGGIGMVIGGATVNLANIALLDVTASASMGGRTAPTRRSAPATAFSAALQRTGRLFNAGISVSNTQAGFRDIASLGGDTDARLEINASAGLSLGHYGSISLAYTAVDRAASDDTTAEAARTPLQWGRPAAMTRRVHLISASYSAELHNVALFATGFRDFAKGGGTGFVLGLSMPLGSRSSASGDLSSGSGGRSAQVQVEQSPVTIGDWGYQASASAAATDHQFGQVQYKSPWGLWTAGVDHVVGHTTLRAEAAGAVATLDGGVFASNAIQDSFAVVDTSGMANIPVLDENRLVGHTDSAGRLLVPDLRAFDVNRIAIDPLQVPQDATIDVTERSVRPPLRSGFVVTFPVRTSRAALLALVDGAGKAVVLGSTASLQPAGTLFPVGFDGAAYIENLSKHNVLLVTQPDGHLCRAQFDYRPIAGEIPKIGPVTCRAIQ